VTAEQRLRVHPYCSIIVFVAVVVAPSVVVRLHWRLREWLSGTFVKFIVVIIAACGHGHTATVSLSAV
jgi:hypothetical protein